MASPTETEFDADVLVVGGGPAGAWAALTAKASGAERVLLADKGYCGTSGATASANTGVWLVPPEQRERATAQRLAQGGGLARREIMEAVLDTTAQQLTQLARVSPTAFCRTTGSASTRFASAFPSHCAARVRCVGQAAFV